MIIYKNNCFLIYNKKLIIANKRIVEDIDKIKDNPTMSRHKPTV